MIFETSATRPRSLSLPSTRVAQRRFCSRLGHVRRVVPIMKCHGAEAPLRPCTPVCAEPICVLHSLQARQWRLWAMRLLVVCRCGQTSICMTPISRIRLSWARRWLRWSLPTLSLVSRPPDHYHHCHIRLVLTMMMVPSCRRWLIVSVTSCEANRQVATNRFNQHRHPDLQRPQRQLQHCCCCQHHRARQLFSTRPRPSRAHRHRREISPG